MAVRRAAKGGEGLQDSLLLLLSEAFEALSSLENSRVTPL